ncbi:EAL domain-containing protein [Vibrio sp. PP-XX7]
MNSRLPESLLMQRSGSNLGILHSLNDFGIRLSIDDFGTGYSSLAYLQDFPVNTLKIDISFIRNIGTERGDAIPSAIIAMAHNLNLNVVAEGVEHGIQEEFLSARKCHLGQGFYYSRSVSGDAFMAMCRTGLPITDGDSSTVKKDNPKRHAGGGPADVLEESKRKYHGCSTKAVFTTEFYVPHDADTCIGRCQRCIECRAGDEPVCGQVAVCPGEDQLAAVCRAKHSCFVERTSHSGNDHSLST